MTEQAIDHTEDTVSRGTMSAMVQDRYGPAVDVLAMRDVPIPEPIDGQVLLRVRASSVNALEWHLMNGKPYVFRASFGFTPKAPTLGADVSGVVQTIGPNVTRFEPGDEVFGEIGAGAYAEYAIADEHRLVAKPRHVPFEEAAGVGVAALTALQGLRDVARLEPGQSVLINGASGGVGTYAVQIAKVLGAHVTAVCSTRNVETALSLGADRVVDYRQEDFTATDRRFDAIFDIAGNRSLTACRRLLRPGGTYVMVGGPKGNWTGPLLRVLRGTLLFAFGDERHRIFTARSRTEDLEYLGDLLGAGKITTVIEDTYQLEDVAIPLDRQGEFHARGKTIVVVGEDR